jgi:acyl phosphate:glycerol-3-phosphate acyltransferase
VIQQAIIIVAAYLLGCCNTGYYLVRLSIGRDIRTMASGGTGSRNVGRALGARGFLCTFIGDAGKGALAIWLARQPDSADWLAMAALLAAVAGHIWPVQLGFRGGKGFATLAGGLALLAPALLLTGFGLSLVLLALVRRTTKAGLLALCCTPAIMAIWRMRGGVALLSADFILYLLLVALVLFGHRDNIRRDFFGGQPAAALE